MESCDKGITMSIHVNRVHELCSHGHSSCTLSTWTEFMMNSIHIPVQKQF